MPTRTGPAPRKDVVDQFVDQWRKERPDLPDLDVMATFGRFGRVFAHATRSIEATLGTWGLQIGEFDVLATVRRAGPPFTLAPSQLTRWLMLSPSGITSRLERLEKLGLIERRPAPDDRRSLLVVLTAQGRRVVDEAVTAHVANEARLLAVLPAPERKALDRALRTLLERFEGSSGRTDPAEAGTPATPARTRRAR